MGDRLAEFLYTTFVNSGHEVAGSDVPNWASLPSGDRERWEQVATRSRGFFAEKDNDEIKMLREANEAWQRKSKPPRPTAHAVLLVRPTVPAQIVGAGIFGEPHPTTNGLQTIPLFDMEADNFATACEMVGQHLESRHYDWCGELKRDPSRGVWRDARTSS